MHVPTAMMLAAWTLGGLSYGQARDRSQEIPNLGRFLEKYVGDCLGNAPEFDRSGCEKEAKKYRKTKFGKIYRLELDDIQEQLHFAGWDRRKKAFRVHLTPFFGERGLALTMGKPSRLNSDGFPILKNIPIWVALPKGETEFMFKRRLERGMLRLELVFKAGKPWGLRGRGGADPIRGVAGRLIGLRVFSSRGSDVLAEQSY
jgi:hypothetical protein